MNEEIVEETVLLYGDDGMLAYVPVVEALRIARERELDLVEESERPAAPRESAVVCKLLRIRRPVAWEGETDDPTDVEPASDPALWFHTDHCSGSASRKARSRTVRRRQATS